MDNNTAVIQQMIDAFTRVVRELETENAALRAENEELRSGLNSSVQAIGFYYDPIGYDEDDEEDERS
jgi:regulator of replication initiation timing